MRAATAALTMTLMTPVASVADSGVSPSRVKLPSGPGSLGGLGEDVQPDYNMGVMGYGVPIDVPPGQTTVSTPSLRLSYQSGGGMSLVGMGWNMGIASIQRMTARGLPRYDQTDLMDASGELVRLPGTDTYRARFEGSFARHHWIDSVGDGRGGYWMTEHPDGNHSYYGADASGAPDPNAIEQGPDGTFRWYRVESVDAFGHRVRYRYVKDDAKSLIDRIEYVFDAMDVPQHVIVFNYEPRADFISDAKPGFIIELTQRLAGIQMLVGGVQRSRRELVYEPYSESGGLTRLSGVRTYGRNDAGPYPIEFRFAYTGVPLARCLGPDCALPYVQQMNSVGVNFAAGNADFIDITGDALPDVVDTTGGVHLVHVNNLTSAGTHQFQMPVQSSVAGAGTMMSAPMVQMVDLNGDGFTDMVDAVNNRVLYNGGGGDWDSSVSAPPGLPDFTTMSANLRFFDYDSDKAVDVIFSDPANTWYYLNQGDGTFATSATIGDVIGAGFAADSLRMADMNGDGLQDAVLDLTGGVINYRIYLGRGRWAPWKTMFGLPATLPSSFNLTDLNGDGLSDVLTVVADTVSYSLNRNGKDFDPPVTITSADVQGSIPDATGKQVRLADMNGSGSSDVVWVNSSGMVTYLELFPMRPNLLNQISNGIGKVIELTYGSSADHMARDGGPSAWTDRLPHPMLVVESIESYDTLSGNATQQTIEYRNGWFDGEEQQFRGFADVVASFTADASIQPGRTIYRFDLGKSDEYWAGRLLETSIEDDGTVIRTVTNEYSECPVADLPGGLDPAIRYVCQTGVVSSLRENSPAAEWVATEQYSTYDGYGNVTEYRQLGITSVGGGSCAPCNRAANEYGAPCGPMCLGDESFKRVEFIPLSNTGGRYMINKATRVLTYGQETGGMELERRTYYDGMPFVGLPLGQLTLGNVTRVEERDSSTTFVDVVRNRHDSHGNPVETMGPMGNRQLMEYDALGLELVAEEIVFEQASQPYKLRMEVTIDPLFRVPVASTNWLLVRSGTVQTPRVNTTYMYDDFGRLVSVLRPGDTLAAPTQEFRYELGDPVSRIITSSRSQSGGPIDLETIACVDGAGRTYQARQRIGPAGYQVDGYVEFNAKGLESRVHQGRLSTSDQCDLTPPAGNMFSETTFDSTGRMLTVTKPDDMVFGTSSRIELRYFPMHSEVWDEVDNDTSDPDNGTPTQTWVDGRGRKTREIINAGGAEQRETLFYYNELGRPSRMVDHAGNEKIQEYDRIGRVVRRVDPDMGEATFQYDAAGNRTHKTDPNGIVARISYDEIGRPISTWDPAADEATRADTTYDFVDGCVPATCYTALGRATKITYPIDTSTTPVTLGTDRLEYDDRGRSTGIVRDLFGTTFRIGTIYDNADRIVGKTFPGGRQMDRVLDGAGRLMAIPTFVSSISYQSGQSIDEMLLGNGTLTTYGFNAAARLDSLVTRDIAGSTLLSYAYDYDRLGNVLSIRDNFPNITGLPTASADLTYDLHGNLIEAVLDAGTVHEETMTYTYDQIGNMTRKGSSWGFDSEAHVGDYLYGENGVGPHSATRAGSITLDYDPSGRVIRKGTDTFSWDSFGRMESAHRGSQLLATYAYDGMSARIRKSEPGREDALYLDPEFETRDGISYLYATVQGRRVARMRNADIQHLVLDDLAPAVISGGNTTPAPDSQITAGDAWVAHAAGGALPALSTATDTPVETLLRGSARRLHLLDGAGAVQDERVYFHHDYRGSVKVVTDQVGAVLQRTEYYPFGHKRFQSRPNHHEYDFEGHETEQNTKLTYMNGRYRDLRLALWMSPHWGFFNLDPEAPAEERVVYGQSVQNPMTGRASMGSTAAPPSSTVRQAARAGAAAAGGTPAPASVRRRVSRVSVATPTTLKDQPPASSTVATLAPMTTKPPALSLYINPIMPPNPASGITVSLPRTPIQPPEHGPDPPPIGTSVVMRVKRHTETTITRQWVPGVPARRANLAVQVEACENKAVYFRLGSGENIVDVCIGACREREGVGTDLAAGLREAYAANNPKLTEAEITQLVDDTLADVQALGDQALARAAAGETNVPHFAFGDNTRDQAYQLSGNLDRTLREAVPGAWEETVNVQQTVEVDFYSITGPGVPNSFSVFDGGGTNSTNEIHNKPSK